METHRICSDCGVDKPIDQFGYWTVSAGNGRKYRRRSCTVCENAKKKAWHLNWREANRERLREYSRNRARKVRASMKPDERARYNEEQAKVAVERRKVLKDRIYAAYGGYLCVCCGETEPTFLSLDHVNNDGFVRRKSGEHKTGEQLFRWIEKNGFPPDFQVLCMNCNHGKSRNGGICPHQLSKVQRLGRESVGSSDPKRPALICDEVKI